MKIQHGKLQIELGKRVATSILAFIYGKIHGRPVQQTKDSYFYICIKYIPLLYYVTIFYVPPPPPQPRLFIAEFTRYLYSEAEIPH